MSEDIKEIAIEHECPSCKGTGLYVGFAERDGAAIVCKSCAGTGKALHVFRYKEFTGRKRRLNVIQVYGHNPGISIGADRIPGGVPFKEWEADPRAPHRPGTEMRGHVCPAWWYQSADYRRKPAWKECIEAGAFSDCENFKAKSTCWRRWDEDEVKRQKARQ